MKEYATKDIRNVVLLGSTRSGKTTLSEAMLYEGKTIDRRGSVEEKNTVSDNTEYEQTNQKSIIATPLYAELGGTKINIIDAPGSDDFCGGALSAFKVCESGILTVNAQSGVEVGTEIYARYAKQYEVPLMVAVNQLDHEKASWEHTLETLKETFGKRIIQLQIPVDVGVNYKGAVDVLTMKFYDEKGAEHEIPAQFVRRSRGSSRRAYRKGR
ncbi:MAG: GTP-binding protein [Candidatus Cryptobacteroides sp.]